MAGWLMAGRSPFAGLRGRAPLARFPASLIRPITGLCWLAIMLCAPARAAGGPQILSACKADQARFCAYAGSGVALQACLAQHHVSLTLACRRALTSARAARQGA